MELLNFRSNGCRYIYNGQISKFNVLNSETRLVESKTSLVIELTIKYEARKTIDNDTIKCINIIDLDQFYEDKLLEFDYDLLYKTIMRALDLDPSHSHELSHKVNELLNKEYFINKTKPNAGFVILVKTEDNESYMGIYEDNAIKVDNDINKNPLEFAKNILKRNDIAKVECIKVDDIYSIIKDIVVCSNYGLIHYKNPKFINNFVSYVTLDDTLFDVISFDNHLGVTVKLKRI